MGCVEFGPVGFEFSLAGL